MGKYIFDAMEEARRPDRLPFQIMGSLANYVPEVGDRLESTNRSSGTVTVGTIAKVSRSLSYYAIDSSGRVLWDQSWHDSGWSFRLLAHGPSHIKVGDMVSGPDLTALPPGTLFSIGYDLRVIMGKGTRYRSVYNGRTWTNHVREEKAYKIVFIPEVGND